MVQDLKINKKASYQGQALETIDFTKENYEQDQSNNISNVV